MVVIVTTGCCMPVGNSAIDISHSELAVSAVTDSSGMQSNSWTPYVADQTIMVDRNLIATALVAYLADLTIRTNHSQTVVST